MQRSLSARSRRLLSDPVDTNDTPTSNSYSKFWCFISILSISICMYLIQTWKPIDYHNIGNVRADQYLSYGPIDVVYTWVNGTDPRWKREKEYWHKHWIASLTGQPLPKKAEDTKEIKGTDVSNADNRFRDNEELRYSLRSLEKYAPWIRHVYIVTDGQIPSWLNLENSNLHIIKHADIFENQTHLPVFSSPAIEWNLDNIPHLSDYFLYFNDDVFLGSYVHPEDFMSQQGVQKAYFAWEAPLCSSGCWDSWLHNGRCDSQCNTTACDYDLGDCGCEVDYTTNKVYCDPIKVAEIQELTPKPMKMSSTLCIGTCQYTWLGDGGCDQACNVTSCGFDAGDCGGPNALLSDPNGFIASIEGNHTLVHVPSTVNATVLDLSTFFGREQSRVLYASHDNEGLIRHATVFEGEMALLLVFGRDETSEPMTEGAIVTVYGQRLVPKEAEEEGGEREYEQVQLEIEVVRGSKPVASTNENKTSGFVSFQNMSIKPRQIRLPLGFRQSTWWIDDINSTSDTPETSIPTIEPELSVFLPFNITGKPIKRGESLTLAMEMNLRLHTDPSTSSVEENDDAEADVDVMWSDSQFCRLTTPGPTIVKKKTVKTVDVDIKGEGKTVEAVGEDGATATVPANYVNKEEDVALCRMVEHGVILSLRLPTHDNVNQEEPTETNEETNERTDTAVSAETVGGEEASSERETVPVVPSHRPQVVDGTICFYNLDQNQRQYCFALALGHFQPQHALVTLRPPPPLTKTEERAAKLALVRNAPYEPYNGPNEAFVEFENGFCRDTTFRVIGFRPRKCYPSEVPAKSHTGPPVDPTVQNTEEGRRLACEALRRRRAQAQGQDNPATKDQKTTTWISQVTDSILSLYQHVSALFHPIGTVERTTDDLEDMEAEEDVCKPLLEQERAAHVAQMTAANAEALLSKDTFGDSLRYVNKLYTRVFGKATSRRRVPSHMPFLLNRRMLREIKELWPKEFQATSSHRFRHPQDFQFSFAYFHYLLNRYKIKPPTLEMIWKEYLDVNRNGILDENEVLTVASLAYGDYPTDEYVEEVKKCLQPSKQEKVKEMSTSQGIVLIAETLTPYLSIEHVRQCTNVTEKLIKNVRRTVENEAVVVPTEEVTFHMLSDQYRTAWNQMLGTRARRTKFVCINDDMKWPSKAVFQILHELFLSIWPKRSQFELPYHLKNRYDHIDEYMAARTRREYYVYVALSVLLVLMIVFRVELKRLIGFQEIARARAESASQITNAIIRQQSQGE